MQGSALDPHSDFDAPCSTAQATPGSQRDDPVLDEHELPRLVPCLSSGDYRERREPLSL